MKLFSLAFQLFLLMDPLGNIPLFISNLKTFNPKRQRAIILRELIIALGIMILFLFLGDALLNLLSVSEQTVLIAGGIILFLIALKMIFPQTTETVEESKAAKEPFIFPLAMPFVAGPAVLAALILYSHQQRPLLTVSALLLAWVPSLLLLLGSSYLKALLGQRGILACERLMGFLLTLISVQMFLQGVSGFLLTK